MSNIETLFRFLMEVSVNLLIYGWETKDLVLDVLVDLLFSTSTCFNTRKRTGQEPCSCIYGASPLELASNTRQARGLVPLFLCRPDRASLSMLASQEVKPGTLSLSYRYTWQSFSVKILLHEKSSQGPCPCFLVDLTELLCRNLLHKKSSQGPCPCFR